MRLSVKLVLPGFTLPNLGLALVLPDESSSKVAGSGEPAYRAEFGRRFLFLVLPDASRTPAWQTTGAETGTAFFGRNVPT
jgi:hypothetical protein